MARVEILAIGTELLLGNVLDTNSHFLSQELAKLGIDCYWHSTVGDNKERIKSAVTQALARADLLITTGGLGPTPDDLTVESLAELFSVAMIFDQSVLSGIQCFFDQRSIQMSESNRKQAFRPEGSEILPNPIGTAPGIKWILTDQLLERANIHSDRHEVVVLTFPGVPQELYLMWHQSAAPFLQKKYGQAALWSCELKHYGIGESALAEKYSQLLSSQNPTVAPYAGEGECRLRVTAKAETVEEAMRIAMPVLKEIKQKSDFQCYGENEETLESVLGTLLRSRGLTLSVAESCTGGLVSKRLTDVPGSSAYIKLNVTAYSNDAKRKILGVSDEVLENSGAVSAQCAKAMALGVRLLAEADIGLSITGIAGPDGGTIEKPVGLIYISIAAANFSYTKDLRLSPKMSRSEIRHRTANEALNVVRLYLLDNQERS